MSSPLFPAPPPSPPRRETPGARSRPDGPVRIEVEGRTEAETAKALSAARAAVAFFDGGRTAGDADNDLGRLRAARPGDTLVLARHTGVILRLGLALARASAGRFDLRRGGGTADAPTLAQAYRLLTGRRLRALSPLDLEWGDLAAAHALDRVHAALGRCGAPPYVARAGAVARVMGRPARLLPRVAGGETAVVDFGQLRSGAAASFAVAGGTGPTVVVFAARALDAAALARALAPGPDAPEVFGLLTRRRARAAVLTGRGRVRWLTEPPPAEVFLTD